jgi:restriction system protein
MPVPDYQSLMLPVLKALADGTETPISEVRERVTAAERLTPDDLREMLASGQPMFTNRVSWAVITWSAPAWWSGYAAPSIV